MFGGSFESWHNLKTLPVDPQVDHRLDPSNPNGFNAYYDRGGLFFYYDKDDITNKEAYASESLEVVSHEAGHAILDAVQPDSVGYLITRNTCFS